MKPTTRLYPILSLGWVLTTGCVTPVAQQHQRPVEALSRFSAALKARDYPAAYALLSRAFRKTHTLESFIAMLKTNPDEVSWILAELDTRPRDVRLTATLTYGGQDRLRLELEEGGWRIVDSPLEIYSQDSPAAALRSFLRAAENRRYEVMLRFVPKKWAEAMSAQKLQQQFEGAKKAEMAELLARLRVNLTAPIQKDGDRAVMPYGDRFAVRFVREGDVWKIEDLD